MRTQFSFAYWCRPASRALPLSALIVLCAGLVLSSPKAVGANDTQSTAVGHIRGKDISVEDGIRTKSDDSGEGIDVTNGNVVTVHSGKARMALLTGGKVEICGPAKFTVLLSGNDITVALNFGRIRAELPAKTSLRVFTPTIIGTPIDISGGSRDITVGLNLDDSLCVLATSGAVQLEHQFSGEKIIVPEQGEFFLNGGQLVPVAGKPGTCNCFADDPNVTPLAPPPEFAKLAPLAAALQPHSNAPRSSSNTPAPAIEVPITALTEEPAPAPDSPPALEYSVLQHANQAHPLAASARSEVSSAPPSSIANQIVAVPALVFSSTTPLPPPGPSPDAILLIREAQVSPEWQFSGHIEPPEFASAMQHALGQKPATSSQPPPAGAQTSAHSKKKGGFWASLRRAFGGS